MAPFYEKPSTASKLLSHYEEAVYSGKITKQIYMIYLKILRNKTANYDKKNQ